MWRKTIWHSTTKIRITLVLKIPHSIPQRPLINTRSRTSQHNSKTHSKIKNWFQSRNPGKSLQSKRKRPQFLKQKTNFHVGKQHRRLEQGRRTQTGRDRQARRPRDRKFRRRHQFIPWDTRPCSVCNPRIGFSTGYGSWGINTVWNSAGIANRSTDMVGGIEPIVERFGKYVGRFGTRVSDFVVDAVFHYQARERKRSSCVWTKWVWFVSSRAFSGFQLPDAC